MSSPAEDLTKDAAKKIAKGYTMTRIGQFISPSSAGQQLEDGSWRFNLVRVGRERVNPKITAIPGVSLTVHPDGSVEGPTREEIRQILSG